MTGAHGLQRWQRGPHPWPLALVQAGPSPYNDGFMTLPRPLSLARLALACLLLPLAACDNKSDLERALLDRRVAELERQIKNLQDRTDQELSQSQGSSQDAATRLDSVEEKVAEATRLAGEASRNHERLGEGLAELARLQREHESLAMLSPDYKGHYAIQTEHGVMLLRLDGLERDFQLGGYIARLSVGNPMGLTVQEFVLKGDFGPEAPKLVSGEAIQDYNKRLEQWQRTLTPFEQTYLQDLPPNAWTRLDLRLKADAGHPIALLRAGMKVRRAHLVNLSGEAKMSPINLRGNTASLLQTDYGALLANVQKVESLGNFTKVSLLIGNPYGFVINKIVLKGEYGPAPPQQGPNERPEEYSKRISNWNDALKPFESSIDATMAPMQWSDTSFLIRDANTTGIAFVRCRVAIDSVTLKAPQ